jgi:hypothetical protein
VGNSALGRRKLVACGVNLVDQEGVQPSLTGCKPVVLALHHRPRRFLPCPMNDEKVAKGVFVVLVGIATSSGDTFCNGHCFFFGKTVRAVLIFVNDHTEALALSLFTVSEHRRVVNTPSEFGCGGTIRTCIRRVNSTLLYRWSYSAIGTRVASCATGLCASSMMRLKLNIFSVLFPSSSLRCWKLLSMHAIASMGVIVGIRS